MGMNVEVIRANDGSNQLQYTFLNEGEFERLDESTLKLPFSDLVRMIPEDENWFAMEKVFPALHRLDRIKQLSFLSYAHDDYNRTYASYQYKHTRKVHTIDEVEVATEIARLSGADDHDLLLQRVAGTLHDIATVAHGDATKLVDPANLHEEDSWQEMVGEAGWEYMRQNGLSRKSIDDAIHNRGVNGRILDIADRISYTMLDAEAVLGAEKRLDELHSHPYTAELKSILLQDKKIGNIYQDVRVDWKKEQVVFTNTDRLANFLYLRAHLHKNLYWYPRNQGRDLFIAHIIKPFYSPNENRKTEGMLTPRVLRTMDDEGLIRYLSDKYGYDIDYMFYHELLSWYPEQESFLTYEPTDVNAQGEKKQKLSDRLDLMLIGTRKVEPFNAGTNYLVVNKRTVEPFRENDPRAKIIEDVSNSIAGTHTFYVSRDNKQICDILENAKKYSEARKDR